VNPSKYLKQVARPRQGLYFILGFSTAVSVTWLVTTKAPDSSIGSAAYFVVPLLILAVAALKSNPVRGERRD